MNEHFIQSLDVMWKGMLSIFVVILLLTLIVMLMGKITEYHQKKHNSDSN